jgi:UTP--glucose-1-phosphate uridylyltransferase
MLSLGRAPVIEHVLLELRDAGVGDVMIVVSPAKDMIRRYFGDGSSWGVRCAYTTQPQMLGVGHAVLCAVAEGARPPFFVAFGDCAILPRLGTSSAPALARLGRSFLAGECDAAVLCEEVPRERTRHYGVLAPANPAEARSGMPFLLGGIVEKPDPAHAPSTLVVAARWLLGAAAVDAIRSQHPAPSGEVGIAEAIADLIAGGGRVIGLPLLPNERRCDVGNPQSLLAAQAYAALNDREYGEAVRSAVGDV